MKLKRIALLVALIVGVAFAAAYAAPVAKQKMAGRPGHCLAFLKTLNLTDDQKAQGKQIFQASREKMKALWTDKTLTREQKAAQMKEIRRTGLMEFRGILNPDQQAKFDKAIKKAGQRIGERRGEIRSKLAMVAKALNLTDDQKAQIKQIVAGHKDELKALKEDTKLTREQKMAQFKQIRESIRTEIRGILTPDQQQKFDQIVSKIGERMRGRRVPAKK